MGNLFFKSSIGERRLVKENIDESNVLREIEKYVKNLNPTYKIYYIRHWKHGNIITYDVGSHSEFFEFEERI